jgi:hypothetical protein
MVQLGPERKWTHVQVGAVLHPFVDGMGANVSA